MLFLPKLGQELDPSLSKFNVLKISNSPLAAGVLNPRLEKTSVFQTPQLELTPLSSELVRVSGEGLGVR